MNERRRLLRCCRGNIARRLSLIMLVLCMNCTAYAQKVLGSMGLMNIPTADMYESKTFVGGANYIANNLLGYDFPTYNYFVGFTPFPFVELTFRSTLLKMRDELPSDSYCEQDRSFTIRVCPLQERADRWCPGIVLGSNDFFSNMGHSYYSTVYGVATKHFGIVDAVTLGCSVGYSKAIDAGKVYDGVFCGVDICPVAYNSLHVMAEYDTSGFNYGVQLNLLKHWNLIVFTRAFNDVSAGFTYQYTIKY